MLSCGSKCVERSLSWALWAAAGHPGLLFPRGCSARGIWFPIWLQVEGNKPLAHSNVGLLSPMEGLDRPPVQSLVQGRVGRHCCLVCSATRSG